MGNVNHLAQRLIIIAAVLLAFGTVSAASGQDPGLPNIEAGLDANASGNQASSLGTIDTCREVASGETFEADFWVRGLPQPVGFTGGLIGFAYNLLYDPAVVHVTGLNNALMIAGAGEPQPFQVVDANPATEEAEPPPSTGGDLRVDYVDLTEQIEGGEGVLSRFTMQAVGAGQTTLQLVSLPDEIDHPLVLPADAGFTYPIPAVQEVVISVGQPCTANPTPRPVERPLDPGAVQPTEPPDGATTPPDGATTPPDSTDPTGQDGTPIDAEATPAPTVEAGDAAVAVDVIPTGNTKSNVDDIDDCAAAEVEETFSVDIVVEDIDDLLAFEIPVLYDNEVLQVEDTEVELFLDQEDSSVIDTSAQTPDPTGRYVTGAVDAADPLSPDSGSGALVRLTMSAKAEGTTDISLDGFDIDEDGEIDRGVYLKNHEAAIIGDEDGDTFFDGPKAAAEIRVGEECDDASARVVTVAADASADPETVDESDGDDDSLLPIALGAGALIAAAGAGAAGYVYYRRRHNQESPL